VARSVLLFIHCVPTHTQIVTNEWPAGCNNDGFNPPGERFAGYAYTGEWFLLWNSKVTQGQHSFQVLCWRKISTVASTVASCVAPSHVMMMMMEREQKQSHGCQHQLQAAVACCGGLQAAVPGPTTTPTTRPALPSTTLLTRQPSHTRWVGYNRAFCSGLSCTLMCSFATAFR
jgi:hypothetical protein